jgi:uncharacterized membrane protein
MRVGDASPAQADHSFTRLLGIVLRAGVLMSAAVVLFGGALYLLRQGSQSAAYGVFRGEPADLRSVTAIIGDAVHCSVAE